jgi:hypothetical protein
MEDNVFFYISENTLSDINTILRYKDEEIIKCISNKKCYNNELLLQEILPSNKKTLQSKNLSDKERCMARLWKGGYGGRCQNIRKDYGLKTECEFCNVHQKEILNKGKLRYGRIDEISPFRLPKNPTEPYKRCIHVSDKKQCRCRMSENSEYCTMHKKIYENHQSDIAGFGIICIKDN